MRRFITLFLTILIFIILSAHERAYAQNDAGLFDFTQALKDIMKPQKKPDFKAVPKPPHKPGTSAPKILQSGHAFTSMGSKDAKAYQKIFALQDAGKIQQADTLIDGLKDKRLYGYVLKQRYLHPTAYRSSFNELKDWLNNYADHPGANDIYELAERKRPKGDNARLPEPQTKIRIVRRVEPTMIVARRYASSINRSNAQAASVRSLQRSISGQINNGRLQNARNTLRQSTLLDNIEYDILQARIAAAYLYRGKDDDAYRLASKSSARSGLHVPLAGWVSGLVSWKRGKYSKAASYFENVGRSNYASSWTRSAGAYWAARAHMRRGDVKAVSTWLRRAASTPRTFYGLIATRALGENFDFNWDMPQFTKEHFKLLSSHPNGMRAIALAQIGELSKAQAELLRVDVSGKANMHEALLAFSGYARLPGLAMRLGSKPANSELNIYYDAALYPFGAWKPIAGFKVDPALVNAIIRQESRFDPDATSASGARGLMQLMPATARSVSDFDKPQMYDPAVNLELGQRYLQELLKSPHVDNNLLSLLIAYNAGPGNLNKWRKQWRKIKDPLLFIELLPASETRAYVEHVLANFWIYRMRDKQPTPTLNAVVAGAPVTYENL